MPFGVPQGHIKTNECQQQMALHSSPPLSIIHNLKQPHSHTTCPHIYQLVLYQYINFYHCKNIYDWVNYQCAMEIRILININSIRWLYKIQISMNFCTSKLIFIHQMEVMPMKNVRWHTIIAGCYYTLHTYVFDDSVL